MNNSVLSSFIFKFCERIMVKGLGLVISIVLARLIAPEVYGLLAVIMVFISLAQTFVQSGLATALVQNRETNENDYSTVFYMSTAIALLANVILFWAAPLIASMYKSPTLISPLRVLSLSLLIGAFNAVQTAKMQREMRFKAMMYCNLFATIISGAVGIYAAWKGLELWALVIYHILQQIIVTTLMLCADRWYPKFYFSFARAKILYGYGWKLLLSALLTSLYNEIRTLIVGYRYSSADLAYYNKGYQFPNIIANTLDVSIQSVMLPVMARKQENRVFLYESLVRTISTSVYITTPVMLGLAAVANTLIPMLLGEAWIPCIPLLCVFCVSELMLPIKSANLSLLKAIGRSDLYMKTEIIRRSLMMVILVATILFFDSVLAIAVGYAVSAFVDTYTIACAVKVELKCTWIQQMSKTWKSFAAGVIMCGVVYYMNLLNLAPMVLLLLQIVAGAMVYLLFSVLLKNEAFDYLTKKIKSLMIRSRV